ncbi:MAG TPA: DUF362 domain-containing protein [Bryobacteraceae bacterium]
MSRPADITRRNALGACIAGALGAHGAVTDKSRVVVARDPLLGRTRASTDSIRLLKVLDRAMQSLYDADNPVEPWRQVVRPGEVVGLKVNGLAGKGASTSVVLVDAICERLRQAGVPERNIVIWDRLNSDLESAGFRVSARKDRIQYVGNDDAGYETELAVHASAASRVAVTLTRTCNAVINLPVLKDHGIVGVTVALKNLFGAIHNPNKYHNDVGDPYVADVYMLPPIRQKVRLAICDAIVAQYEGGPSYMPQWCWPYNGLIVSRDPVALDYTGWQILERKRAERGMPSLRNARREPTYIARAADPQHHLGVNDPARIDLVEA